MNIVVDTSVIIAVVTNEKHKAQLIELTKGADLIAPSSLHWEVGNAFSAMFKRKKIDLKQAKLALAAYQQIPIRFLSVRLADALELSIQFNLYAYDAYVLNCALKNKSPLITLDGRLVKAARKAGIGILEIRT